MLASAVPPEQEVSFLRTAQHCEQQVHRTTLPSLDNWNSDNLGQNQCRGARGGFNDTSFTDAPQGEFDSRQAGFDQYGRAGAGVGGGYPGNTTDSSAIGAGGGLGEGRQQREWEGSNSGPGTGGFNDEDYGTSGQDDYGSGTGQGAGRTGGKSSFGDKLKGEWIWV